MKRIRVQLTTAEKWPHYDGPKSVNPAAWWSKWRGTWIWVGPPEKPTSSHWWCPDADVVWPVPEEWNPQVYEVLGICGQETHYVCRHQLEAAD